MNTVLDSSAWIEYFTNGKRADVFAEMIEFGDYVVPSITIYEVYKKFLTFYDETEALNAIAHMQKGKVVELTEYLAVWAAKLSKDFKIPMADSIILATAYSTGSIVWTLDADFKGVEGVNYFPSKE
jgi:predicted nucleic acid-binding protein